jgi:predicted pyridoxine 5'-phosphate oxidase superfamily flavin-nucleotide-binding protein
MRRLADGVEQRMVRTEISAQHREFIESRDMFYLATIDHQGRPTVSYKGGNPGFVRVVDSTTIVFPCYDGNGMFYSMGNLIGNNKVGMLFISFVRPHRLRVQGIATVDENDPLLAECFEAQMIVRVLVTEIFRNCPRYVHQYKKLEASEYVPRLGMKTPLAGWKRVDSLQAELATKDRGRAVREGGTCSREEYEKYMDYVSCNDGET